MKQVSRQVKISALFALTCISLIASMLAGPIPQAPEYHRFIDQRMIYGIPNFWNVLSNIPFALFGCIGLYTIIKAFSISKPDHHRDAYTLFFAGAIFVSFGSAWYHLNPTNNSLFWDRLPMTIMFMSLFSIIISEYVSDRTGRLLLWPLIILGALSVVYWFLGEQKGVGDLRPYALVQFLPLLLIPLILVLFKLRDSANVYLWIMLTCYLFSKIAEYYDAEIYNLSGWISGHSLKHLLAALGVMFFYIRTHNLIMRTR
jgi:hypothetical protein